MKNALVWAFLFLLIVAALIAARGARRESWPMVCGAFALAAVVIVAIRYMLIR